MDGGVKVLSKKTEILFKMNDGSGIDFNKPGDLNFSSTADPFSTHYLFSI
jgi:hypothetical protein